MLVTVIWDSLISAFITGHLDEALEKIDHVSLLMHAAIVEYQLILSK